MFLAICSLDDPSWATAGGRIQLLWPLTMLLVLKYGVPMAVSDTPLRANIDSDVSWPFTVMS